jgi:hypothetical protein
MKLPFEAHFIQSGDSVQGHGGCLTFAKEFCSVFVDTLLHSPAVWYVDND